MGFTARTFGTAFTPVGFFLRCHAIRISLINHNELIPAVLTSQSLRRPIGGLYCARPRDAFFVRSFPDRRQPGSWESGPDCCSCPYRASIAPHHFPSYKDNGLTSVAERSRARPGCAQGRENSKTLARSSETLTARMGRARWLAEERGRFRGSQVCVADKGGNSGTLPCP